MFLGRGTKAKLLLHGDAQGLQQELVPRTVDMEDEPAGLNDQRGPRNPGLSAPTARSVPLHLLTAVAWSQAAG